VLVPDGAELPQQPAQVQATLQAVAMKTELAEKLRLASPVVVLTKARIEGNAAKVRYSKRDELTLLQANTILPSAVDKAAKTITMDAHITDYRAWDKKAVANIKEIQ